MLETPLIPDNLEACQQQLRALAEAHAQLQRVHEELLDTCTSIQDSQQKLEQERNELQLTIQRLLRQLYGRRSERRKDGEGQRHLDFGDSIEDACTLPVVLRRAKEKEPRLPSREERGSLTSLRSEAWRAVNPRGHIACDAAPNARQSR